ncbi:hypothetical protein CRENBAI_015455 [Crenichthys baileyi]|uniref:Uncharacterized protein n=1 Tax=Crenichthys baileyi TaxID=28760 RepID=A0AAV9RXK3_9TELE
MDDSELYGMNFSTHFSVTLTSTTAQEEEESELNKNAMLQHGSLFPPGFRREPDKRGMRSSHNKVDFPTRPEEEVIGIAASQAFIPACPGSESYPATPRPLKEPNVPLLFGSVHTWMTGQLRFPQLVT